jgi:acyl-CoA dehydrogenase
MNGTSGSNVNGAVNSETAELTATLRAVFADHPAEVTDGMPAKLWATLTDLGVTRLTLPESAGGSGGSLEDAAALLLAAGEAAAPVPLAETDLLGAWLLHAAGLAVPADGPLAVAEAAAGSLEVSPASGSAVRVCGTLRKVGWARYATRIAVLTAGPDGNDVVLGIDPAAGGVIVSDGANMAGEPRDDLVVDLEVSEVAPAPENARELLERRAALARALLMAGAGATALRQAVRYAGEREQFGRSIGKFQAVQQQLAMAAAEVAAARAAVDAATRIAAAGDFVGDDAGLAIAVAKARAGEMAGEVARITHQVHGAIGFTFEHSLRLATTRLWSWRDEDGNETRWNSEVAHRALAAGADGLWALITRSS